jgi:hypothetical protein
MTRVGHGMGQQCPELATAWGGGGMFCFLHVVRWPWPRLSTAWASRGLG